MTICDNRRRIPLLYPPFGIDERAQILKTLVKESQRIEDIRISDFVLEMVRDLARIWSSAEAFVNFRGAMGTGAVGISSLAALLFKFSTGLDRMFEFMSTAPTVEWAGAVGANLIPIYTTDGYSDEATSNVLAGLYTGVPINWIPNYDSLVNRAAGNILSVGKDVPVVDFANAFRGGDIDRFRLLVKEMVKHNASQEEIDKAVLDFNKSVRAYEKRAERLNVWDIKGLILDGVANLMRIFLRRWMIGPSY